MKKIIYLVFVVSLYNCGSIPKYRDHNLKPITDVKQIEGVYKNYTNDSLKLHHLSLNGRFNWRKKEVDTNQYSSVKIKILDDKRLKLDFQIENNNLKIKIIKYRLRNNGFIKLRNKNFRVSGIPYIFGEYAIKKFELGLSLDNNLILHGVDDEAGGLLIVLSANHEFKVNALYQRI